MRKLNIQIALLDNNKLAILENGSGLPQDKIESQLLIIGLLDNLKQKHLDTLKTLYEQTVKNDKEDLDL
jgi:hypothetical protein